MDFGRAFSFTFQDPDWLKKVGIAAVVFLIPLVGPIILLGWGLEITRRVIHNDPVPLPDWSDFSGFLSKGFQEFVVNLAYVLPVILLVFCGQAAGFGLAAAADSNNSGALGALLTVVGLLVACIVTILAIIAGFLIPAATGNLAATGELGAAFRFNEVIGLVRAAPGPYVMVILGVALANIILAPLGSLVCGIGLLATTAYTTALSGHLSGQAYLAAKAAQAAGSSI